jgi:hypothetical protein
VGGEDNRVARRLRELIALQLALNIDLGQEGIIIYSDPSSSKQQYAETHQDRPVANTDQPEVNPRAERSHGSRQSQTL